MRTTLSLFSHSDFATTSAGSVLARIGGLAARILRAPLRFYAARAQLTRLAALNDHELSDIGLTRTDLEMASALPLEIEPTTELARLVQERRVHRPRR